MTCPHCGERIESSQDRYIDRMRAKGCCVTCGKPHKTDHYQCFGCRLKRAAREKQRWLKRTRADIPEQRA